MESQACSGKNIWILANKDKSDPAFLEDLTVGGYHLRPVALGNNTTLHPPQCIDLALLDLAQVTHDAMVSIMRLREKYQGPLAVLDEHPNERRHILSLAIGADDYLAKPVSSPILTARIEALLRRCRQKASQPSAVIRLDDLVIDATRREVAQAGQVIRLTTVEFKLLWHLASHAGSVVSRSNIHLALYNREYNGIDRSVDMYISRVRKKLGDDPSNPRLLKTIRGDGYLFASAMPAV